MAIFLFVLAPARFYLGGIIVFTFYFLGNSEFRFRSVLFYIGSACFALLFYAGGEEMLYLSTKNITKFVTEDKRIFRYSSLFFTIFLIPIVIAESMHMNWNRYIGIFLLFLSYFAAAFFANFRELEFSSSTLETISWIFRIFSIFCALLAIIFGFVNLLAGDWSSIF